MRVLILTPALPSESDPGSMAPAARQIRSLMELGVEMHVQEMRGIPRLKYLQAVPRMWSQLQHVDLIHAHFGYCGWLARLQFRKPTVVSFMGDDLLGTPNADGSRQVFSRLMVRANRCLAGWVSQVIVKSPEMARVVQPVAAHIIPNGVDIRLFQPHDMAEARCRLNWDAQQIVLLFPGNPENPRKGFALAEAATRVAESRCGRSIRIVPLWGVPPDQVPLMMNACHAMWMVSMIEGSPNVVKEAMACNLPVVSVPVGDTVGLLERVPGNRIALRNATALGQAMAELLVSGECSTGRQAIIDRKLDVQSVARRILYVYELAMGRSQRTADRPCPTELRGSVATIGDA